MRERKNISVICTSAIGCFYTIENQGKRRQIPQLKIYHRYNSPHGYHNKQQLIYSSTEHWECTFECKQLRKERETVLAGIFTLWKKHTSLGVVCDQQGCSRFKSHLERKLGEEGYKKDYLLYPKWLLFVFSFLPSKMGEKDNLASVSAQQKISLRGQQTNGQFSGYIFLNFMFSK